MQIVAQVVHDFGSFGQILKQLRLFRQQFEVDKPSLEGSKIAVYRSYLEKQSVDMLWGKFSVFPVLDLCHSGGYSILPFYFDMEKNWNSCKSACVREIVEMVEKIGVREECQREQAVQLFLLENPAVQSELARAVVLFNWSRGVRSPEDLACIEQFAHTYSDVE